MILNQPITLADKILTSTYLPLVDINISTKQMESGPPVYEITATAGQSVETQRHTFGNVEGTGPMPTTMQGWLDDARQATANAAAWDEHIRIAAGTLS